MLFLYNSLRSKNKEKDQQDKRDRVLPFSGNLPNAEVLGEAEKQSAERRARNAADAADDRRDHALQEQGKAHRRLATRIESDEDSRETRDRPADENRPADDA